MSAWVCSFCHSINEARHDTCYSCRRGRVDVASQVHAYQTDTPWQASPDHRAAEPSFLTRCCSAYRLSPGRLLLPVASFCSRWPFTRGLNGRYSLYSFWRSILYSWWLGHFGTQSHAPFSPRSSRHRRRRGTCGPLDASSSSSCRSWSFPGSLSLPVGSTQTPCAPAHAAGSVSSARAVVRVPGHVSNVGRQRADRRKGYNLRSLRSEFDVRPPLMAVRVVDCVRRRGIPRPSSASPWCFPGSRVIQVREIESLRSGVSSRPWRSMTSPPRTLRHSRPLRSIPPDVSGSDRRGC